MSYWNSEHVEIEEFLGMTFTKISGEVGDEEIKFTNDNGDIFVMYHSQDCCEGVYLEDVAGDISDLVGSPILEAECVTNSEDTLGRIEYPDSFTWTFYKLGTIKGHVTLRWLGVSSGYYSEDVQIRKEILN